jgi:hypothetical protein
MLTKLEAQDIEASVRDLVPFADDKALESRASSMAGKIP